MSVIPSPSVQFIVVDSPTAMIIGPLGCTVTVKFIDFTYSLLTKKFYCSEALKMHNNNSYLSLIANFNIGDNNMYLCI